VKDGDAIALFVLADQERARGDFSVAGVSANNQDCSLLGRLS
jgi:hypothetical protein